MGAGKAPRVFLCWHLVDVSGLPGSRPCAQLHALPAGGTGRAGAALAGASGTEQRHSAVLGAGERGRPGTGSALAPPEGAGHAATWALGPLPLGTVRADVGCLEPQSAGNFV